MSPRVCPHCNYIGHRHLCGCMGKLGLALRAGDLATARAEYERIVANANADARAERAT